MEPVNVKRHLFEFIVDHKERLNCWVRRSELRRHFSSLSDDVDLHLEQLAREGLLVLDGESIALTPSCRAVQSIRFLGGSSTGGANRHKKPVADAIAVDLRAIGVDHDGELFAHVVCDDSMVDAGIRAKDVAIVRSGAPTRGEIVAVEVGGKVVFRRYLIIKNIPHLLAENHVQPDLVASLDVHLHGILCCTISTGFASATRTLPPADEKVNYACRRVARHGASRWPAPPSGFGLNESKDSKYTARPWTRTRDDPPDHPYGRKPARNARAHYRPEEKNESGPPVAFSNKVKTKKGAQGEPGAERVQVTSKTARRRPERGFLRA